MAENNTDLMIAASEGEKTRKKARTRPKSQKTPQKEPQQKTLRRLKSTCKNGERAIR